MAAVLVLRWRSSVLEVLLQRRSSWIHHGNTWTFPGGSLDPPEKEVISNRTQPWGAKMNAWQVTALREAVEEAGGGELGDLPPCDASSVGFAGPATLPPGLAELGRGGRGMTAVKDNKGNTMYFCYCIGEGDKGYDTDWNPRAIKACRSEVDEQHALTTYGYRWDAVEEVIRNPRTPVKGSSDALVVWVKGVCERQGDQLLFACQMAAAGGTEPLRMIPPTTRPSSSHQYNRHQVCDARYATGDRLGRHLGPAESPGESVLSQLQARAPPRPSDGVHVGTEGMHGGTDDAAGSRAEDDVPVRAAVRSPRKKDRLQ